MKKTHTMEPNNSSCESSFCKDEEVDLLEECWFFDNLLTIKPKMSRCHSDPYPSSGLISPDFLGKDSDVSSSNSSTSKPSPKKIQRAPSMPQFRVKEEDKKGSRLVHQPSDPIVLQAASKPQMKEHYHKKECNRRKTKLLRTPSLPPSIGREEKFQETDSRIGRSCKQPSTPTHIDNLPPRRTSKVLSLLLL